jgi:hypothetical protein
VNLLTHQVSATHCLGQNLSVQYWWPNTWNEYFPSAWGGEGQNAELQ